VTPHAWVVVAPATEDERVVPLDGRLLVGRECAGVEPSRCLIIDDPSISRDHLELRSDPGRSSLLVDSSTNGTWLNGRRVERGEPISLADGDCIQLAGHELVFHVRSGAAGAGEARRTVLRVDVLHMAIVVGDVVGYTALTEAHGVRDVAELSDDLFDAIRRLLPSHGGTVVNYVGDAILTAWDVDRDAAAVERAIRFALAADELVRDRAPALRLRGPHGEPLRMGWAVTLGEAAAGHPSATHQTVHGDAVNLAFRLSGLAARDGLPPVLVTSDAATAAPGAARYGDPRELRVKGRTAPARAVGAERAPD
jgi:class 3 adenylate cyclase